MATDFYQKDLLRLAARARGAERLAAPDATVELDNPLCGDRITMDVAIADGRVSGVGYKVRGCLLCQAAASVIGANAVDQPLATARAAATEAERVLDNGAPAPELAWADLAAFEPVAQVKSRHECVLLPVKAFTAALDQAGRGG